MRGRLVALGLVVFSLSASCAYVHHQLSATADDNAMELCGSIRDQDAQVIKTERDLTTLYSGPASASAALAGLRVSYLTFADEANSQGYPDVADAASGMAGALQLLANSVGGTRSELDDAFGSQDTALKEINDACSHFKWEQ